MLVLRDLAARWKERACRGSERSLDYFLEEWVAQQLPGWSGHLTEYLAKETGPRPILLVDGWDEIGPLGDELRQKLMGFLWRYPRVLAVVTSRPYGESRPSHSDGFEVLDIQLLSDVDIKFLAKRFFTHCHGLDQATADQGTERFMRALKNSPEPLRLARTALLLTMMLLIARSRPLPDKRHLLYQACVENLLAALPNRKEEEGGLNMPEQWRPSDIEERMRLTAELAFRLKSGEGEERIRTDNSVIVSSWEKMAGLLTESWAEARKMGFLAWLAGPAGLLTDRSDGTLIFTHLSFQEYLAAWHLDATIEGPERVTTFHNLADKREWWETLRLWSALIERHSPSRLEPVITRLMHKAAGISLLGCLFADGLGSDSTFIDWANRLALIITWRSCEGIETCALAWSASQQEQRKNEL
jgi:hypothetical protein